MHILNEFIARKANANMAKTPESSKHTSVQKRISRLNKGHKEPHCLEQFVGPKQEDPGIPFKLEDYLDLIDWTGRIIRHHKRGAIDENLPPILERLNLPPDACKVLTTPFEHQFSNWVGSEHFVKAACSNQGYKHVPSTQQLRQLFPS